MGIRNFRKYKIVDDRYIPLTKSVKSVSIRLPLEIYSFIMESDGDNFSDKLVKLILRYMELIK